MISYARNLVKRAKDKNFTPFLMKLSQKVFEKNQKMC